MKATTSIKSLLKLTFTTIKLFNLNTINYFDIIIILALVCALKLVRPFEASLTFMGNIYEWILMPPDLSTDFNDFVFKR